MTRLEHIYKEYRLALKNQRPGYNKLYVLIHPAHWQDIVTSENIYGAVQASHSGYSLFGMPVIKTTEVKLFEVVGVIR